MNIAHIVSSTTHFPLPTHHGRYEWVLGLAKAQASQGHTVTIYCAPGSGKNMPELLWQSSPHQFQDRTLDKIALIKTALTNQAHDIYHSHLDFDHYFLADCTTKPIVFTQHWFPNETVSHAAYFNTHKNVIAVPVTQYMLAEDKRLNIPSSEVIYHGIDLGQFVFSDKPANRFIFVGRIHPRKGIDLAIKYARAAGVKLDIVGKVNDSELPFWQSLSSEVDGDQIRYLGPKPHTELPAIFARAKALIFPCQEIEAFGLVTVEAQACGTPVIINDIGASRELVQDGVSGFVASSESDFIKAIRQVDTIRRAACRAQAEKFDVKQMIADYQKLYQQLSV